MPRIRRLRPQGSVPALRPALRPGNDANSIYHTIASLNSHRRGGCCGCSPVFCLRKASFIELPCGEHGGAACANCGRGYDSCRGSKRHPAAVSSGGHQCLGAGAPSRHTSVVAAVQCGHPRCCCHAQAPTVGGRLETVTTDVEGVECTCDVAAQYFTPVATSEAHVSHLQDWSRAGLLKRLHSIHTSNRQHMSQDHYSAVHGTPWVLPARPGVQLPQILRACGRHEIFG